MKEWLICPDGETAKIEDCIKKCRMAERCAPAPYLEMVREQRKWKGRPSVTMLSVGIRKTWLQIKTPFGESPDGQAFRSLGVGTHARLEKFGDDHETESFLMLDGVSGVTDLVEEQDNGENWLIDYKTVGSFAIVKMLGISKVGFRDVLDWDGNPKILSRGPNKGKIAQDPIWGIDSAKADLSDYTIQPNCYKLAWEDENPGKTVDKLKIFAIVRDGGLAVTRTRGVTMNTYYIDIPILSEKYVRGWVKDRRDKIVAAMKSDKMPPMCTGAECWGGSMCKGYCAVAEACKANGDNLYLGGVEQIEAAKEVAPCLESSEKAPTKSDESEPGELL